MLPPESDPPIRRHTRSARYYGEPRPRPFRAGGVPRRPSSPSDAYFRPFALDRQTRREFFPSGGHGGGDASARSIAPRQPSTPYRWSGFRPDHRHRLGWGRPDLP